MDTLDQVWDRICRHAGQTFRTINGLEFQYFVPGSYLRISRDGREINRSLSRTNFQKAAELMPAVGPGQLKHQQGSSYTWAILMDPRVRASDW